MSVPAVHAEAVSVDGRQTPRLRNASIRIPIGARCAIIGPNGAGKSTLLHALAGVLRPKSGTVRVDGVDPSAEPRSALAARVSFMPQAVPMPFAYRAIEVCLMGGAHRRGAMGFASDEEVEEAHAALRALEVDHLAEAPMHVLSGGEQQRVRFATQLVQRARVALFDEPTSAQDYAGAAGMARAFRRLTDAGVTVVAAVHDLNFAARAFDTMALVAGGEVVAFGPPSDVLRSDRFAAAYRGGFTLLDGDPVTVVPALGDDTTPG